MCLCAYCNFWDAYVKASADILRRLTVRCSNVTDPTSKVMFALANSDASPNPESRQMSDSNLAALEEIFRSELDDDALRITRETSQTNLAAWDSLAHVRIVAAVEEKFGLLFDIEEIETLTTVEKLMKAIERQGS